MAVPLESVVSSDHAYLINCAASPRFPTRGSFGRPSAQLLLLQWFMLVARVHKTRQFIISLSKPYFSPRYSSRFPMANQTDLQPVPYALKSDRSNLIPFSSRLRDGRALALDVWTIFRFVVTYLRMLQLIYLFCVARPICQ